ncbi:MAG: hypothetical protein LBD76_04485 [Prevotellaceae bacterium]|nr:hypothetical protein [Prevotellaceae bacterium]
MKKFWIIIVLLICGITVSEKAYARKFYWVGGAGNWSEISHWGKFSGATINSGDTYTEIPIASDTVIFDDNSGFTNTNDASRTITLNVQGECHDLLFQGTGVKPFFKLNNNLIIAGSLYLQPGMTLSSSASANPYSIYFGATSFSEDGNYTITTNGITFPYIRIEFRGNSGTGGLGTWTSVKHFKTTLSSPNYSVTVSGGKWIARDSVTIGKMIFTGGTVDWGGQSVSIINFTSNNANTRVLDIRNASIVVCYTINTYNLEVWNYSGTGSSLIADNSTLKITPNINYFVSSNSYKITTTLDPLHHYNKIITDASTDASITNAGLLFNTSFLTDTLIVRTNIGLKPGTTATVNKYLEAEGCKKYILLCGYNGTIYGTAYIDMGTGGTTRVNNIALQHIHISGNNSPFAAGTSADIDGNNGWTFTPATGQKTYFWVGGSGKWDDVNHWSTSSGGTPGDGCLPMINDNVVFDAGSGFTDTDKTVSIEYYPAYCHNMTWKVPPDIKPVLTFGYQPAFLYLYGSLVLQKDMSMNISYPQHTVGIIMKSGHADSITTNGVVLPKYSNSYHFLVFNGTGTWTVMDDFSCAGAVQLLSGNLVMNGKTVNLGGFSSDNSNPRSLDIRNSVITLNDYISHRSSDTPANQFSAWCYTGANSTLQAAGSHLRMNSSSSYGYYYHNAINGDSTHRYNKVSFLRIGEIQNYLITDTLAIEGKDVGIFFFRYNNNPLPTTFPIAKIHKYFKADDCHTYKEIKSYSTLFTGNIEFASGCKVEIINAKIDHVNATGGTYDVTNSVITSSTGWNNTVSSNTYYWVGGEGEWSDGSHWANASGGPSGSGCVPNIGDSAVFDKLSFTNSSYIVTVSTEANCKGMKWHNIDLLPQKPELNLKASLNVHGSIELQSGMSITTSGSFIINMQGNTSSTLKSNGVAIPYLTYSGTGTLTVLDDLRVSSTFAMTGGNDAKINMSNINAVLGAFNSTNYATNRSLDIQNSLIELTGSHNAYAWDVIYLNLLTAGSTLKLNKSNSDRNRFNDNSGNSVYNKVVFMQSGIISNSVTIDSLFIGDSNTSNITVEIPNNRTVTINKYLESIDCHNIKTLKPTTSTSTISIQPDATINMDHTLLANLKFTNPDTVYNCIDGGGNTGITFSNTGKTYYWVGGKGEWNDVNHWSYSSGGSGGACVPLAGDDVVFNNKSGFSSDDTVRVSSSAYCRNMTWRSTTSNYPHFELNSNLYIYGSLEWQQGMTVYVSYPAQIIFVAPDDATVKSNGVVIKGNATTSQIIEFNSEHGKWTMTDDFALHGGLQFEKGQIIMKGINVTLYYLLSNPSNNRHLDISNSSVRIVNNNTTSQNAWTYYGNNTTLSASGSVIYINTRVNNAYFEVLESNNYNKVVLESSTLIYSYATVDTLIIKQNSGINVTVNSSRSLTVNKYFESLHCSGFNRIYGSNSSSLKLGDDANVNIDHLKIDIPVTGTKTPYQAFSSVNTSNFAGWDTSKGRNIYWVGGGGNWTDQSHWASSSGGTAGTGCMPSTADNVFFDKNSGFDTLTASNRTVTINNSGCYCRNMIWHNMGSQVYKPVFAGIYSMDINGSIEFQEGMTASYRGHIYMKPTDSITIKSNGVQNNAFFHFDGTGAYKILDNFINTYSGSYTYFTSGRLYMNGVKVQMGDFYSGITDNPDRHLDIRNSNISVMSWNYTGNNITLLADSSRINLTNKNALNTAKGFKGLKTHTYDTVVVEQKSHIFGGTVLNTLILNPGFDGSANSSDNTFSFISNDTVTINRKFITSGTPCDVVKINAVTNTGISTSPAYICVPVSEYNIDPSVPIGFDLNSSEVSYIHIVEGEHKAKVRLTNVSREFVLKSNTGGWVITPYTGLEGVTLGKDTSMWCTSSFYISTYKFYGDHNTKYLWNDGSTEDHLTITDAGKYWVDISYSEKCTTTDSLYVSRINDIQLTGTASPAGGQVKISLSTSGLSSFDPNPVFVLDSVQPAGAIAGLPLLQYSPDFYFPVGVRAFFSHTDSLSECKAVYETITPLTAVNDTSLLFNYNPVKIAVLDNDIYFLEQDYCTSVSATLSDQMTAQHGTAQLLNDTLIYTPDYGWTGIDSLDYVLISCGAKDTARVYIIVFRDTYNACTGIAVTMELPDIPAMTYIWRDAQTGGSVVTKGRTYTVTKNDVQTDIGTWWIEVTWNGTVYLNFPVQLLDGVSSIAAYISKFTGDTVILSGSSTTLTAHAIPMVVNPVFEWYSEATGGTLFNTNANYTTSSLTADTTFYVTVLGNNVCSSSERKPVTVHIIQRPAGAADHYSTPVNTAVACPVLDNDFLPETCTNLSITVVTHPNFGTADVTNDTIVYTPTEGLYGIDSLEYEIDCGIIRSYPVKAYVITCKPASLKYIACENTKVTLGFYSITDVTYNWYDSPSSMTPVTNGSETNTLAVTKNSSPMQSLWAEPVYAGIAYPRIEMVVYLGDNCGTTIPTGCAATGTVIFKEDFGGNNVSDSVVSNIAYPSCSYGFCAQNDFNSVQNCVRTNNHYGISKRSFNYGNDNTGIWYDNIIDHTYPSDNDRGYFMFINAGNDKTQIFEKQIDNLCGSTELTFSAWLVSAVQTRKQWTDSTAIRFQIEDMSGNVLAQYYTGTVRDGDPSWKQYGFQFKLPDGVSSVKCKIINECSGISGADFMIDDIEIRLCAPPVTTNITGNDTIVCSGNKLDITGTYTADCTFGNDLAYRWEFRHVDNVTWTVLAPANTETIDCNTSPVITKTVSLTSASKASNGYYRMLVSSTSNIDNANCRAASDSVYVHVVEKYVAPDLRIQICPSPPGRSIRLSSYIEPSDYDQILWEQVSPYPVITNTEAGLIVDKNFQKNATYTYRYTLSSPENSGCGSTSAKVYVRTLNNRILGKTIDTITICQALNNSKTINLNQLFGLALDGAWSYPNDSKNVTENNVTVYTLPSQYAGAYVFNAQKAYAEADSNYNISYKGVQAKRFEFVYTATSCISVMKKIVLIVTN